MRSNCLLQKETITSFDLAYWCIFLDAFSILYLCKMFHIAFCGFNMHNNTELWLFEAWLLLMFRVFLCTRISLLLNNFISKKNNS